MEMTLELELGAVYALKMECGRVFNVALPTPASQSSHKIAR